MSMNQSHLQNYLKRIAIMMVIFLLISLLSFVVSYLAYSGTGGSGGNLSTIEENVSNMDNQLTDLVASKDNIQSRLEAVEKQQEILQQMVESGNFQAVTNGQQTQEVTTPTTQQGEQQQEQTQQAQQTTQPVVKTKAGKLNFRSEPTTGSSVLRVLNINESLTVLGETQQSGGYTWIKVQDATGATGWVAQSFVSQ
jgi:hypothetical protein